MRRTRFNDGWMYRLKRHAQLGMQRGPTDWAPVTLPHDAMIGMERSPDADAANGYFPGGVWEYQVTLTPGAHDLDSELVLEFEGVYRDAMVFVNDTMVARHPYGYSGFFVPIGQLLRRDAEDTIRVQARAGSDSRWYSGAGIYRDVWLLGGPDVHLGAGGLRVRTPQVEDDGAIIEVVAAVRNSSRHASELHLRVEVVDSDSNVVAASTAPVTTFAGDTVNARQRVHLPFPRRWGLEHPYLYECRVELLDAGVVIDRDSTMFGIRTIAVDPRRGLRINEQPVLLRGACVHHDNGVIGAATIDRAEERRVELLEAAGFNAIRSAHNPMSKAMLDACDRAGVVVIDETFDMWLQPKSTDDYALRFDDWWEADVGAMVAKDFNHPCVLFYSIGNEIPDGSTPTGTRTGRALVATVRELDDTRLVTQAINGLLVGGPEMFAQFSEEASRSGAGEDAEINMTMTTLFHELSKMMTSDVVTEKMSEAVSYLDVAGYNYMTSRFELDREIFPHGVIVASETYPSTLDTGWAGVTSQPHVLGDFTWTGWDYLGEAGMGRVVYEDDGQSSGRRSFLGEYPWLSAWCGDIDILGQRRPQSYYREIVWGLRAEPYIAVRRPDNVARRIAHSSPWSWSDVVSTWTWDCPEGTLLTVEVYSGADEVELVSNGRSLGRRPAGPDNRYRAEFDTVYAPGELVAVALRGGEEVSRTGLQSATGPPMLEACADRARIRSDGSDLAFVSIALVDSAGSLYNTSDRRVEVVVEGPGVVQGMGSANPRSVERFTTTACTTFDGRALAVLRPTGVGVITVSLSAEGCDSRFLSIEAVEAP